MHHGFDRPFAIFHCAISDTCTCMEIYKLIPGDNNSFKFVLQVSPIHHCGIIISQEALQYGFESQSDFFERPTRTLSH